MWQKRCFVALAWCAVGVGLVAAGAPSFVAANSRPPLCDGAVGDCQCDVKAVENANSKQLGVILEELSESTFFRLFKVRSPLLSPGLGVRAGPSGSHPTAPPRARPPAARPPARRPP